MKKLILLAVVSMFAVSSMAFAGETGEKKDLPCPAPAAGKAKNLPGKGDDSEKEDKTGGKKSGGAT